MVSIIIGKNSFKTKNSALQYYRKYIYSLSNNIYEYNTHEFNELIKLIELHPDFNNKTKNNNICGIEIKNNIWNKKTKDIFIICDDDFKIIPISWRYCIKSPPTEKMILTMIMRKAIHSYVLNYRNNNNNPICQLCLSSNDIHVDHYDIMFYQIRDKWIDNDQNKINDILNNKENASVIPDWIIYHNNSAHLRFLCRTCNLSNK